MAKFQLQAGETLIGKGPMSLYQKQGLTQKPFQGKIYVTDKRICFYMDLSGTVLMELPIGEIKNFTVGSMLFITKVTIQSKQGEPDSRQKNCRAGCCNWEFKKHKAPIEGKAPPAAGPFSVLLFRSFDIGNNKSLKFIYCVTFVRLLLENLNQVEHRGLLRH